jgi:hypothetical protein
MRVKFSRANDRPNEPEERGRLLEELKIILGADPKTRLAAAG